MGVYNGEPTQIFFPAYEMISRGLYQKLMHTNLLSRSLYQKLMICTCIGVYRSVHVTQILPVDWS